jgi:hypothetical protein
MVKFSPLAKKKPKMLKANDAETLIIHEWRRWAPEHTEATRSRDGGAMEFFEFLEKERPDFLDFRCNGSKWHGVHMWLLRTGRI